MARKGPLIDKVTAESGRERERDGIVKIAIARLSDGSWRGASDMYLILDGIFSRIVTCL